MWLEAAISEGRVTEHFCNPENLVGADGTPGPGLTSLRSLLRYSLCWISSKIVRLHLFCPSYLLLFIFVSAIVMFPPFG